VGTTGKQRAELQALLDRETEEKKILNDQSRALNAKLHVSIGSFLCIVFDVCCVVISSMKMLAFWLHLEFECLICCAWRVKY